MLTLLAMAIYLFVPPLFYGKPYVESAGEWGYIALSAMFIAIVAWAVIGKIQELGKDE